MKRFLALFLALVMVLSLAGCGRKSLQDKILEDLEDKLGGDIESVLEGLGDIEGYLPDEEDYDSSDDDKPKGNAASAEGLLDIVDLVVADTDMYAITISDVEYDDYWEAYTLNVLLENKSDIELEFDLVDVSINGILADMFMWEILEAGKKVYNEVELYVDFETMGIYEDIGDYTDIALTFAIDDNEEWEEIGRESVHIYPQGEKKATVFERKAQSGDEVIVDNEYVTVTVVGCETNEDGDFSVRMFIVNKTDEHLSFDVDDEAVNDFMINNYLNMELPAGMSGYGALTWYSYELEDNHIDAVEEIEFSLYAENEDWDTLFETDIITLKP